MTNTTDFAFRKSMQFTTLVPVEVEMSFSQYKYLLIDHRICLIEKNIEIIKMIMFNQ